MAKDLREEVVKCRQYHFQRHHRSCLLFKAFIIPGILLAIFSDLAPFIGWLGGILGLIAVVWFQRQADYHLEQMRTCDVLLIAADALGVPDEMWKLMNYYSPDKLFLVE